MFVSVVQRIMENAEEASLGHKYDKELGERLKMKIEDNGYHYFNAKKINIIDEDSSEDESYWERALSAIDREPNDKRNQVGYTRIKLESNKHFSGIPVNANYSTVHVPTNVYDGGKCHRVFMRLNFIYNLKKHVTYKLTCYKLYISF